MRFNTLSEWLRWQESMHPNAIDLGLERVQRVLAAMGLEQPPYRVLTVGGTNGKGSCVAFLDAMLRAQGYAVGAYTSPHLLRYNERVCIQGLEVSDAELVEAFASVEAARGTVSLTYFEFGTLAAFEIFRRRGVEVAVLEVGMGGRLDAVNVLQPEGALVASVALDHQEWLGYDRDSIGFEKAGIYRAGRPAICGDRDPPTRLLDTTRRLGAELQVLGRDYDWQAAGMYWDWHGRGSHIQQLPCPAMPGDRQVDNAASCIALLQMLCASLPVEAAAIRQGLRSARIHARFELWQGDVSWILDVAHNPAAAAVLAANLKANPARGRTLAVVGMLRDKAVEEVVRLLAPQLDSWYVAGLEGARGQTAAELAGRIQAALPAARLTACGDVTAACHAARSAARSGDRILVFGSFLTVGAVLRSACRNPVAITTESG
ncbi:MAG: bifunctional tetrahydrofolate synthase/dihydrofolate synthase [Gammaproteobacteria bacterium]|nr:bifunctional tetrahydrofolate synthase/dihydrofolate synthase [Gammaproteobacteria bacterium]MDE2345292.1 bifunctional tetrahydrofolate synthase/dihydrofolate synthase [Gammaproteobacteria bacterium]